MAVVAVAGNDLVARPQRHLHADNHCFLADIQVAETADQAHAVHLTGLLFEAADGQHGAIGGEFLLLAEIGDGFGVCARGFLGDRHWHSLRKRPAIVSGRRWAFRNPNSLNPPVAKARDRHAELRKTPENWLKISRRAVDNAAAPSRLLAWDRATGSDRAGLCSQGGPGPVHPACPGRYDRHGAARPGAPTLRLSALSLFNSPFIAVSCCSRSCCARKPWLPVKAFAAK